MTSTRARGSTLAAVALLASAACARPIDGAKVEAAIKGLAGKNGLVLASVTCPRDRPLALGGTLQCQSTTTDGAAVAWDVTQTDENGNFDVQSSGIADEERLGQQATAKLRSQHGDATVTCASKWVVPRAGAKFSCGAVVNGYDTTVDCVFSDATKVDCTPRRT